MIRALLYYDLSCHCLWSCKKKLWFILQYPPLVWVSYRWQSIWYIFWWKKNTRSWSGTYWIMWKTNIAWFFDIVLDFPHWAISSRGRSIHIRTWNLLSRWEGINRIGVIFCIGLLVIFMSECGRLRLTLWKSTVTFFSSYSIHWLQGIQVGYHRVFHRRANGHCVSFLLPRLCGVAMEPLYRRVLWPHVFIRCWFMFHINWIPPTNWFGKHLYRVDWGAAGSGSLYNGPLQSYRRRPGDHIWYKSQKHYGRYDVQEWYPARAWEKLTRFFKGTSTW